MRAVKLSLEQAQAPPTLAPALASSLAHQKLAAPHITHLRLVDFRNHALFDMHCQSGAVLLTGDNGVGKTNVLEAISMLGNGRGLRSDRLENMHRLCAAGTHDNADNAPNNIPNNISRWQVLADIASPTGAMRAIVQHSAGDGGRHLQIDGEAVRGFELLSSSLPQLWLTPIMDRLFVDAASGRRKFLDRFAQALTSGLARQAAQFEKAMRERNKLLQMPDTALRDNRWLDALEDTMAVHGVGLAVGRLVALDALAEGIAQITPRTEGIFPHAEVALEGMLEADLRQFSALEVEDSYRAHLTQHRAADAAAGRALDGPHRSDLRVIRTATQTATRATPAMPAAFCSTGEQKALLVALVLAQAHSVAAHTATVPLLLLDEVTAHLDATRRQALAEILADLGSQNWITGTDINLLSGFGAAASHITL